MLPLQVRARTWMRSGRGAGDSPQEGDPTVAAGPPFSLEPGGGWWSRVAKLRDPLAALCAFAQPQGASVYPLSCDKGQEL